MTQLSIGDTMTLPHEGGTMPSDVQANSALIREVYEYWIEKTYTKGRKPVLGSHRRTKINARLNEGFTVDDLKLAIDGVLLSPWHMGENPAGRKYLDIVTILRDASNVEKFIELAEDTADNPMDAFIKEFDNEG